MKILHVSDYLMPSMGYQDFLLAKWNKKQKNETYIITSNQYFPVPNYEMTWQKFLGKRKQKEGWSIMDGVRILRKKIYFEIRARPWISNLENEIKKINPDIILVHNTTSFSSIRVAYLCKKENIPCMFDNHMVYSAVSNSFVAKMFYFCVKNFISRYISKVAYRIIGVTEETCSYLNSLEGYKKTKIAHLPLGIDDEVFYPYTKKINVRKKNKIFKVIQTGKLNEDKKPQWTAQAVLEILKKGENISLEFIGSGSKKIRSQIEKDFSYYNFSKKLKFTEYQDKHNLAISYNKCDLCIFPDGTSLSALEVAACRKPVIMANYLASKKRARLGIGVTYKVGDIKDLQNKILLLFKNHNLYKKVSNTGYKIIKEKFTYKDISKSFIKLCYEAVKSKKL